ncbi:MAG TPA: alpha/beta fold hydrolase [Polyangia bacterium]|jgi:pimeloyl-ACP methyl ester carboxylesterase|nr:alpha/beta fold hydrolase [Polyangia bacterium]
MRLRVAGVEIGFDDVGEGPPIVLLHAFPLDRRMWQRQVDDLKHALRVITVDFRGLGESTGAGTVEDAADDVARVLDHCGLARAAVGGLSMGGYVSLAFARRHADRLTGLLLANTRAGADDAAGRVKRDEAITRVARDGVATFVADAVPRLLSGKDPQAVRMALSLAELQSAAGVAGALAALRDRPDASAALGRIAVPTTVVLGDLDGVTTPDVLRAMAASIPGAVLVEIPGVGHLSNLEAPAAFVAAIEALMSRVAQVAAPA